MIEREGFVVMTLAQARELLSEVEQVANEAFQAGTKAGYEDGKECAAQEAFDAGYEQGYSDGHADGYMEGTDEFGHDWAAGYAEGHEAGYIEAELRCAEAAAFEEEPRIHSWVEGEQID